MPCFDTYKCICSKWIKNDEIYVVFIPWIVRKLLFRAVLPFTDVEILNHYFMCIYICIYWSYLNYVFACKQSKWIIRFTLFINVLIINLNEKSSSISCLSMIATGSIIWPYKPDNVRQFHVICNAMIHQLNLLQCPRCISPGMKQCVSYQ